MIEVWDNSKQGKGWNFNFQRLFNDWEMDNVESLIGKVRGRKINSEEEDNMVWKANKDGSYTVRSNLDVLEGGRGAGPFPKKWFGTSKVLTLNQLKRRGFSRANRCYLCGKEEEI